MDEWVFDVIDLPKMTWRCEVSPNWAWHFEEGKQPNWFHRKMQYLVLGIRWSRINQEGEE